jgi:hypothetical protein
MIHVKNIFIFLISPVFMVNLENLSNPASGTQHLSEHETTTLILLNQLKEPSYTHEDSAGNGKDNQQASAGFRVPVLEVRAFYGAGRYACVEETLHWLKDNGYITSIDQMYIHLSNEGIITDLN